jgi:hypothetical protein
MNLESYPSGSGQYVPQVGGADKSPKDRLGMMVLSLTFVAQYGRSQRSWGLTESSGAKRDWALQPPRTCYSPEDNAQLG